MKTKQPTIVPLPNSEGAGQNPKIVALSAPKAKKASEEKWGRAVMDMGFCIIPSLLLRAQDRLGLSPTQLAVLLQLCDYWWENGRKPHPSKATIAGRLRLSPRQVQRHIAALEEGGFVERIERRARNKGKTTNDYDLTGLVKKLQKLEPSFRKAEETAKRARAEAGRSGYAARAAMQAMAESA